VHIHDLDGAFVTMASERITGPSHLYNGSARIGEGYHRIMMPILRGKAMLRRAISLAD
jgi:hypothetical protein